MARILGIANSKIPSWLSTPHGLDHLDLLFHPCPRHNRFSGVVVLLHDHKQPVGAVEVGPSCRVSFRTLPLRGAKAHHGCLQSASVVVFTLWPCMPPRLLSDPDVEGPSGHVARSFGFVVTVHGKDGTSSVWTQNEFCNQYGKH